MSAAERRLVKMKLNAGRDQGYDQAVAALNWSAIQADLDKRGCAVAGPLLSQAKCAELIEAYDSEEAFRSRVVMARHGFGQGEYKYFSYPLPQPVEQLRTALYLRLVKIANRWQAAWNGKVYPSTHGHYLNLCHRAGQRLPTPLLLKYGEGDFNCLHRDLYGELVFPLQVAILLSVPEADFTGGEFVLTEQRPRMQSRVEVVTLHQGEGVIFAVNQRPVQGSRGTYRVAMRHGVSRLRSGQRYTLGIIFHDAA